MRELYVGGFEGNPHSRSVIIERIEVASLFEPATARPQLLDLLRLIVPLATISKGAEGRGVTIEWLESEGWKPVSDL